MSFAFLGQLSSAAPVFQIAGLSFDFRAICLLVLSAVLAASAAIGLWLIGQREDRHRRLQAALTAARRETITITPEARGARQATWYDRVGTTVANSVLVGRAEQERLLTALSRAGIRGRGRLSTFIAAKFLGAIAFGLACWFLVELRGVFAGFLVLRLALLLFTLIVGWRLPDIILTRLVAQRRVQLETGIPDAIDLLVICAEAGLNLGQAIEEIGRDLRSSNKVVAEEFSITAAEMRVLSDRGEALENLARRTGLESLRGMITTLNQSIRFGTPLTESLGILAATMRTERVARLEERAARLPVMLSVPLMIFVMPSLLMVIGTPVGLRVMDQLRSIINAGG